VSRSLKLVRAASAPAGAEQEELIEYVKQLFDQIEAIYRSDLGSATDTSDVVDRLTANLRYAHDVFARRVSSADGGDLALFEQQLAILLDARSETSFGRHLAIAAFNYAPSETTPP
jgi:hypothetical protein